VEVDGLFQHVAQQAAGTGPHWGIVVGQDGLQQLIVFCNPSKTTQHLITHHSNNDQHTTGYICTCCLWFPQMGHTFKRQLKCYLFHILWADIRHYLALFWCLCEYSSAHKSPDLLSYMTADITYFW